MRRLLSALALIGIMSVTTAPAVSAAPPLPLTTFAVCSAGSPNFLLLRTWDACLSKNANGVPQFSGLNDLWLIVFVLVEDFIILAGYTAVGFIIWGGIKYLKSQGEPGETQQARQIIYNAIYGLVLVMISIAIVNFVAGAF